MRLRRVLDFEFVYRGDRTDIEVTTSDINRPGLNWPDFLITSPARGFRYWERPK